MQYALFEPPPSIGASAMLYQIIPLEIGSLVERQIYQQANKEIKCGTVWKFGSVVTELKPSFMKNYDPNEGICIVDIPGGSINQAYEGEKVIYFSETVEEDEQNELMDIFYQSTKKYSKNYADVFYDLGWKQISSQAFIFGELEIKELRDLPHTHK